MTHKDVPGWFNFEDIYDTAVNCGQNGDVFVEVGSFLGKSACYMLEKIEESNKNIQFYCVDLFKITPDAGDGCMPWGQNAREWEAQNGGVDAVYKAFLNNISNNCASNLAGHYRADSAASAANFADKSVTFCFIDASHLYENVLKDLEAWYPKMKSGAVLAGHDYDSGEGGVGKAVKEFCLKYNLEFNNNYSFFIKIP